MSRDQAQDEALIQGTEDLVAWFASGAKGDAKRGVGSEHEKLGFDGETLKPLAYEGDNGIGKLLSEMAERYDWEPYLDEGNIMALLRDGAAVTLEPGGQLELSGGIMPTIFDARTELATHLTEVGEIAADLGQKWTHLGLNLWDQPDDIPWMPKSRYGVMRRYLGSRGERAHWMMKSTCTVQANFDYRDEADAMRMLAITTRLAPLVTSLFAATPGRLGALTKAASERMIVWESVDSNRCGTPEAYLRGDAGFADVVEWVLDIPMLFVVRDGKYRDVSGTPFRDLLEGRVEGLRATIGDWELHMSAIFPDARMKRYIEVRTADAGLPDHLLALPALWKGVLYDESSLRAAEALVSSIDLKTHLALSRDAARGGLDGTFLGRPTRDVAAELLEIAGNGLDAQAEDGPSERIFLSPLMDRDGAPVAPTEAIRDLWERCDGDRATMIEAFSLGVPS